MLLRYFSKFIKVFAFGVLQFLFSLTVLAQYNTTIDNPTEVKVSKTESFVDSTFSQQQPSVCMAVLLKFSQADELRFEKWLALMLSKITVPMQINLGTSAIQNCMDLKPRILIIMAHTMPVSIDWVTSEQSRISPTAQQKKHILVNEVTPGSFSYIYSKELLNLIRNSGLKHLYFQSCSWQFLFSPEQFKKYTDEGIHISGAKPVSENNFDQQLTNFITDIPEFLEQINSN